MADQIDHLVTAQRNLLGDVSHELRSPLSRLIVANSLMSGASEEELLEYQQRIRMEAERLDKLIGQLLTLTRIDSEVDSSLRENFDLTNLVREVAADADFEGLPHERRAKVVSAEPCRMFGVTELMRSAIENVVRNAVRHTDSGTTVEITLERQRSSSGSGNEPQTACLSVRDYGPGVPDAELNSIFRPFHRSPLPSEPIAPTGTLEANGNGEPSKMRPDISTNGAGLGLAISERAVQMHGGTITARNMNGGGLMIEFQLPLI
jgi:two-component system sensor histidine kinase CpxA